MGTFADFVTVVNVINVIKFRIGDYSGRFSSLRKKRSMLEPR